MDRTAFDDFFDEQMSDPARAEAYREARAEIEGDAREQERNTGAVNPQDADRQKGEPHDRDGLQDALDDGVRAASRAAQGPARPPAARAPYAPRETTAGARLRGLRACWGRRHLRRLDAPRIADPVLVAERPHLRVVVVGKRGHERLVETSQHHEARAAEAERAAVSLE